MQLVLALAPTRISQPVVVRLIHLLKCDGQMVSQAIASLSNALNGPDLPGWYAKEMDS